MEENILTHEEEVKILNEVELETVGIKSIPMKETEELVDEYQEFKKRIADMKKQQDAIKKELENRISNQAYTSDKYMVYFDMVKSMRVNNELVECFVMDHGGKMSEVKKESISKTLRIKERK